MSLILDALRKSEGQRQRHAGPGLATVPEAPADRGPPRWTLVLGGLLVVNALLVAALFLTDGPGPVTEPAATAPAPAAAAPAPRPVTLPPATRAQRQEVRPLSAELPPPAPTGAGDALGAPATGTSSPPASTTPPATRAAVTAAPSSQATEDARLPRMSELVVRGELDVPDMHLDIHVYSGNPAERFVFINMRKYKEGDATREGPVVERISEAGVVMRHDGRRFVLPKD